MFEGIPSGAQLVETSAPRVTLRNSFAHPFDSAIAAARTCYADASHHPRRNHRQAAPQHRRRHLLQRPSHRLSARHISNLASKTSAANSSGPSSTPIPSTIPSSKASATFASITPRPTFPPSISTSANLASEIYEQAVVNAWDYYRRTFYSPDQRRPRDPQRHLARRPNVHPKRIQKIERAAEKRAIEIARYVLPVAAFTTMVHTISGIVLHRLWRMSAASRHAQRISRRQSATWSTK